MRRCRAACVVSVSGQPAGIPKEIGPSGCSAIMVLRTDRGTPTSARMCCAAWRDRRRIRVQPIALELTACDCQRVLPGEREYHIDEVVLPCHCSQREEHRTLRGRERCHRTIATIRRVPRWKPRAKSPRLM